MRSKPQSHKVKRMLNDKGGIFKILSLFNKDENKVNYLLCKYVFVKMFFQYHTLEPPKKKNTNYSTCQTPDEMFMMDTQTKGYHDLTFVLKKQDKGSPGFCQIFSKLFA